MKEDLKDILLMGLGAVALTSDKAKELKEELLKEGTKLYEEGKVKNEELKHHIKENFSVVIENNPPTKEDIINTIKTMSKEEKEELLSLLHDGDEQKASKTESKK